MGLRMDQTFIRQTLIDRMRRHGESLEQAASSFAQGMGVPVSDLAPAVDSIRHEGRRNMLLDSPPGVYAKSVTAEARMAGWSTGPEEDDEIWPRLRANLESGRLGDAVDEVDKASTKVVAHLADPHIQSLKSAAMSSDTSSRARPRTTPRLARRAGLRKREHLDIRTVYPDQLCLRSSQAGFIDHAGR